MDEKRLEEMYKATMENNSMLKSMRRSAFVGGIFKAIWWVFIIIVLPYLTWLYIQPYLDGVLNQYQQVQGTGAQFSAQAADLQKQLGGFDIQKLFSQFVGGGTK